MKPQIRPSRIGTRRYPPIMQDCQGREDGGEGSQSKYNYPFTPPSQNEYGESGADGGNDNSTALACDGHSAAILKRE